MKLLLIILFGIVSSTSKAQDFTMLEDSLTKRTVQTWLQCRDTVASQALGSCLARIEYTFHKTGRKGTRKKCTGNKITTNNFTWSVEKKNNDYLVVVKNEEDREDYFSIQMIKAGNKTETRLTQHDYDRKEFQRFCKKRK